jgi:hypothetical protein
MLALVLALSAPASAADLGQRDADLDAPPLVFSSQLHAVKTVAPAWPDVESNRDVSCTVRVRIDEQGSPYTVLPELCAVEYFGPTRVAIEQWRWAPVELGTRAIKAEFVFTATFAHTARPGAEVSTNVSSTATHRPIARAGDECVTTATVAADGTASNLATSNVACQSTLTAASIPSWRATVDGTTTCDVAFSASRKTRNVSVDGCDGAARRAARDIVKAWGWTPGDYQLALTLTP